MLLKGHYWGFSAESFKGMFVVRRRGHQEDFLPDPGGKHGGVGLTGGGRRDVSKLLTLGSVYFLCFFFLMIKH